MDGLRVSASHLIRPYRHADREPVTHMLADLDRLYPSGLEWLETRLDAVESGKAALDLAMVGGSIGAAAISTPKGVHRAKLSTFLVGPQYRRRGIGRALLRHLAQRWRDQDLDQVAVTVNVEDHATADFFMRNGFVPVAGAQVSYGADRFDRVLLWTPDAATRPAALA